MNKNTKIRTIFGECSLSIVEENNVVKFRIYLIAKENEINSINRIIVDIGKFETLINGSSLFLESIGLIQNKQLFPYTKNNIEDVRTFTVNKTIDGERREYFCEITIKDKESINENDIENLINNIQRFQIIKESLVFLRDEFNINNI